MNLLYERNKWTSARIKIDKKREVTVCLVRQLMESNWKWIEKFFDGFRWDFYVHCRCDFVLHKMDWVESNEK